MKRSIHIFIFGVLSLLVILISGVSAACQASPNCDCKPQNIKGCNTDDIVLGGTACGMEFGCELRNDIYQLSNDGKFCHSESCTNGCAVDIPVSKCKEMSFMSYYYAQIQYFIAS